MASRLVARATLRSSTLLCGRAPLLRSALAPSVSPLRCGVSAVRFGPDFFSAVPIAVLAFGNQVNVHQVVRELNEPTPARRAQVILCTNGLVTAVYAAIGVAGCELFRNQREFLKKDGNALLCLRQFLCLLPFHFSIYQS